MNHTDNQQHHETQYHTPADTHTTCKDSCKPMCCGKKFWLGAIFRILLMVGLVIAAYKCGMHYGMMKGMWMNSMGGMQQWHYMKGMKNREGMAGKMMNKNNQPQTNDGVPVMTITEGTGTSTGN